MFPYIKNFPWLKQQILAFYSCQYIFHKICVVEIYTFNFFPTTQSNDQIKLKEAAEAKINAFLSLLGGDAELLTEGEPIGSHELFDRLTSKKALEGEDEGEESELKYLQIIRDIRENEPDLFEKIKGLPKKARTAKENKEIYDALITYFRRGKLQKFFISISFKALCYIIHNWTRRSSNLVTKTKILTE